MKDPGSFTIPCTIEEFEFQKALCDLGASINLMPYSIAKKLSLGEITPTNVTLQMADTTLAKPEGIIEDVMVKVGKFIFQLTSSYWIWRKIHKSLCCWEGHS